MPKYSVRNPEIEALLNMLGRMLKELMPKGWGFSLLIFNFGPGGAMFYTSSAKRQDMIAAMREFIAKFGEN